MNTYSRKKVLFVITKSNWGEKWVGTYFARLAQLFCEYLEQNSERAETELNILFQRVASYFLKNSDNPYCFCKKDSVCKKVCFYCTRSMFRCKHPNKNIVCKSKTAPSRPANK